MVWRRLGQLRFGLANRISDAIAACEWRNPCLLRDIRFGSEVVVACDLSGDHPDARYRAIGLLIAATANSAQWLESRKQVRGELIAGRRMSYKALGDGVKRAALVPFLGAASTLTGSLVVFLISKDMKTLFSDPGDLRLLPELVVATRGWKPKSFHRLLLVASLGALLVSCLSHDDQSILWINDEDELAANAYKQNHAGHVISHCIERYCPRHRGTFVFITTEKTFDRGFRDDVVAIPDLAAGAMVEVFSKMARKGTSVADGLWLPLSPNVAPKATAIVRWLAENSNPLSTLIVTLEPIGNAIDISVFRPSAVQGHTFVLRA